MKRVLTLLAFAVAFAGSNSKAAAQGAPMPYTPPPQMGPAAAYQAQVAVVQNRYGVNPCLRNLFGHKSCAGCKTCGQASAVNKHNHYVPPQMQPTGGTLAFPHQPFTRSPRDFFEK